MKWKHYMSNPFQFKYMQFKKRIESNRFPINHFKKTINILFEKSIDGNFPHPKRGDRAGIMIKGYWLDYKNMTFGIMNCATGVTKK